MTQKELNEDLLRVVKKDGDKDSYIKKIKSLLEKGADIEAKDEDGYTALMWAAANGSVEAVKVLLENGADVNAKDKDGNTALVWAANNGNVEAVKVLLENGADIEAKDKRGNTALIQAAYKGNIEAVKLLLENGADVNAKDKLGETALMWAANNGSVEAVKVLLEKGADVNAKDKRGNTALVWAASQGYSDIVTLLEQHSANIEENKNKNTVVTVSDEKVNSDNLEEMKSTLQKFVAAPTASTKELDDKLISELEESAILWDELKIVNKTIDSYNKAFPTKNTKTAGISDFDISAYSTRANKLNENFSIYCTIHSQEETPKNFEEYLQDLEVIIESKKFIEGLTQERKDKVKSIATETTQNIIENLKVKE